MKTVLKKSLNFNMTILILSLISLLLGVISAALGEIMIPFVVGGLSSLYLFDTKSKHSVSIIVSLIILGLNAAAVIMHYSVSLFAPTAIVLSLILSFAFKRGYCKSDASYLMTVIAAGFSLIAYMLFAMFEQGSFTVDAAIDYYDDLIDSLRAIFTEGMIEVYKASGIEVSEDAIIAVFNQQINMIISYLLIGGFVITGVGMKLFGAIVTFCSEDKSEIKNWRFKANRIYAYFYVILIIVSLFATSADSIFAISVLNLYNIFMVIFAYIGFTVALDLLKKRLKPILAGIILLATLLLFASFAAQILAAFGVLYTLRRDENHSSDTV